MSDTLEMMERVRRRREVMDLMAAPDDQSVGDAVARAFQDLYEGAIEKPAKNVLAGYKAGASSMYDLGANAMMLINRAGDYLTEKTGVGKKSKESAFGAVERWLRKAAKDVAPDAESLDDDVISKIYQGLGSAPAAIAEYATGAKALGPVAGFAAVDALRAAEEEPEQIAIEAAKGALMGGAFKGVEGLKRLPRTGALATLGGAAAVGEGGEPEDIAAGAATLGILGALGGPGRVGLRDIYRQPRGAKQYPQEQARQDVLELVERIREQAPRPTEPRPPAATPPVPAPAPVRPFQLPRVEPRPQPTPEVPLGPVPPFRMPAIERPSAYEAMHAAGEKAEAAARATGQAPITQHLPPEPMRAQAPAKKKRARPVRPERDILEFLSNRGGVVDQTGELKAMDAHRWHREKPFRPRLVNERGLTPDYAREAAEEAGYLRKGSSIDDLYRAMDDALRSRGGKTVEQEVAQQERAAAMPIDRAEIEYRADSLGIPQEVISRTSTERLAEIINREQRILDEIPFDITPIGKQQVVPGAERISEREMIERQMQGRKGANVPQKGADEALFDVMGRGQKEMFTFPGPIAGIERAWRPVADRIIDSLAEGKYSPFARLMRGYPFKDPTMGELPQRAEYLGRRGEAQGQIYRFNRMANRLNDTLRRANETERMAIYEYLTTKNAKPEIVPEKFRGAAVASKSTIKKIGRELVRRGLLSKEAYEKHADAYLPRVYLKFLLERSPFTTGLRKSEEGYLKRRIEDLPQEYRDLFLGEVRDPGFLVTKAVSVPARDLALQDFLRDLTYNGRWVLPESTVDWIAPGMSQPRKVTPFWLKKESEILRDRARRMPDADMRRRATLIADQMAQTADQALGALKGNVPKDYRQMPDSPRYGDLRGLVVRKEIYNDLVGQGQMWVGEKGFYEKTWDKLGTANAIWKTMKVPLNPPTQIRNFISNGVLLHLSGVPMGRLPGLYVRALREIARNGKHYRVAVKNGIPASTFAAEELLQIMPDVLRVKGQKGGISGRLYKMAEPLARLGKAPGDLYQFSETWGKTVKIIDAMERQGMSERQAVAAAQEALFDYSMVPPLVKALRSRPIGAPFITFYYKAFPAVTKAAIRSPGKMAMYYLLPYVLGDALLANLRDVQPEDVEKLREALPKWMREQGHTYVFPYKDESGRWTFTNFGYFLPWAMHERTLRNAYEIATGDYGGTVNDLFSELGILGGPVPQVMAAIQTGIDPFTQREIFDDTDPPKVQLYKALKWAWQLAGPSWLTDRGVVGHVRRSLENEPNYYGEPPLSMPQALARGAGVNIYPVDPEATRARNLRRMGFEIEESRRGGRRAMRHPALSDEEREDLRKQYREEILKKIERLREYERRSIVHPNLR